jgi:small subunit ribosomal protein S8e
MAVSQFRSKRKTTGGRYSSFRKKKQYELGNLPSSTKIGKKSTQTNRVRGGNSKIKSLMDEIANIYDPKSKKYSKVKIKAVLDNPANRHFARRSIITMGAILDTEKGKAKVTNRPGQEGQINAVLV